MILPEMAKWARRKGIDLLGTGDFTHPLWFRELKANLEETDEGLYRLRGEEEPLFLLTTEVSSIYSQGGKLRRIHNVIFAPNLSVVEKINETLLKRGVNLSSDGRPIMGLTSEVLAELVLGIDENCLIIPAHVWTPWFSLFGSESGFDSLKECFGKMSPYIYAVETGLSSDPAMNWRISELNNRRIVSFSDAHSGPKLGREATVFAGSENGISNFTYEDIQRAIKGESGGLKIAYTIEFHPEEGKYHYTGHRNCKVRQSPEETQKLGKICPVCGKSLTVGVMHRVEQLSESRIQNPEFRMNKSGVRWVVDSQNKRPPYIMFVPLLEILAESLGSLTSSQKVINEYIKLTDALGGEFNVLLRVDLGEITKISGLKVSDGIAKVRSGDIVVEPGYDGEFGVVKIWSSEPEETTSKEEKSQLNLFHD